MVADKTDEKTGRWASKQEQTTGSHEEHKGTYLGTKTDDLTLAGIMRNQEQVGVCGQVSLGDYRADDKPNWVSEWSGQPGEWEQGEKSEDLRWAARGGQVWG